jgi:hypothetical protein
MTGQQAFDDLSKVSWGVAARTFGNDHATLIGLLIAWWVSEDPSTRWAIEGGPNFKHGQLDGGQCDALLCQGEHAVGVLEVEGSRLPYTIDKIGNFFTAEKDDLHSLEFAILLLYSCGAEGRGSMRRWQPVMDLKGEVENHIKNLSIKNPDKAIIVITLDKLYERQSVGIRALSEYYWGKPTELHAKLWKAGHQVQKSTLLTSKSNDVQS